MPFILYRSSAGSGKTYTLVKEYLKIVLKNPDDFRHILAITFTNKAAREMKDRVLRNLRELSEFETATSNAKILGLLNTLQEETGLPAIQIIRRSSEVLQMILHQYSDFSITTIDSFTHRVIRTFAHDLHLPLDFEVELENEVIVSQAVHNLIRQVGKNDALTKALVDLVLNKSEDEKGWNIEQDLEDIGNQLFKESGQIAMEVFQEHHMDLEKSREMLKLIRKMRKDLVNMLKELGGKGLAIIGRENIPDSAFFYGSSGVPKYFRSMANGEIANIIPNTRVMAAMEEDNWYSKNTDQSLKSAIDSIKDELRDVFEKIDLIRQHEYPEYITFRILERNLLPLAVLHLIDNELQEIKKENNILPIGEFNKRIADTVLHEAVPFIYERLGEWYHYYLFDEFQDTSVFQWLNLLPLIENSLAGGFTSILVGDGKQAIYRWRNGDVEQFSRLPEVYAPMKQDIPEGRKLILAREYKEYVLEKNFRTAAEIVNFNNEFFTVLTSFLDDSHKKIYKYVEQKSREDNEGGYVSIEFFLKGEDDISLNDTQLPRILEIVRKCQQDGFALQDIAVLCRSNYNASLVSRYLMNEGINVSSSESILLKNSPKVNALLACLGLINNPSDQVRQEILVKYRELYAKSEDTEAFIVRNEYRGIPIYELTEKLVRDMGFDRLPDPFIIFFLDTVLQYSRLQYTSVSGFLDWWEDNKNSLSLKTPEDYEAVRVTTIHKAKGLEFNVVIYPFANEKRKVSGNSIWVNFDNPKLPDLKVALMPLSKDMEDSTLAEEYETEEHRIRLDFLNVLYVAMTRPKERLYVLTGKPSDKFENVNRTADLFGIYLQSQGIDPAKPENIVRGVESPKKDQSEKSTPGFEFHSVHSSDWTERMSIRQNHPGDWDVNKPDKPRSVGTLVHQILSDITCFEDADKVIEQHRLDGFFEDKLLDDVQNYLQKMQADIDLMPFFSTVADIRNEVEILTPEGRSYRPDRLVILPDKVMILDYKTGIPSESHGRQLVQYSGLLKQMGYTTTESYLYYLEDSKGLVQVS